MSDEIGRVPPVILIGMHRSGTSVLTRALDRLGVFVGWRLDENHEARFFRKLNDWALCQANASWDDPGAFRLLDSFQRQQIRRVFVRHMRGLRRLEFLGPRRFVACADVRRLSIPWGWKDPRSTFTLEIWAEIFTDARIIHLHRMPLDVAASLRRRGDETRRSLRSDFERRVDELLLRRRPIFGSSPRVRSLDEGLRLWQAYVEQANRLRENLGRRMLTIRYETLVDEPVSTLSQVLDFLGMSAKDDTIEQVAEMIDSRRKYQFIESAELVDLYRTLQSQEIVRSLGYDRIL